MGALCCSVQPRVSDLYSIEQDARSKTVILGQLHRLEHYTVAEEVTACETFV
jgi:hypothetical protein